MSTHAVIEKAKNYIRGRFSGEGTGHDWWHIYRVWKMAAKIAETEKAHVLTVELAALFHEIADHKLAEQPAHELNLAETLLTSWGIEPRQVKRVIHIVENVSFKGAGVRDSMKSLEGKIVQDADRLDAIGAIGIARTFAYGGSKKRLLHDPEQLPLKHESFEEYKNSASPTINHFYEKLLLLKDRMHTLTARKIAEKRHLFMGKYLEEFYQEWDGLK